MKYIQRGILFVLLILAGCGDSGTNITKEENALIFEGKTLIPNGTSFSLFNFEQRQKSKDTPEISEQQKNAMRETLLNYSRRKNAQYVAFMSSKKKEKFKYSYFKLKPDKSDIEQANGEPLFYFILFVNPQTYEAYRIIAAIIPKTENQKEAIQEWAEKFGFTRENTKGEQREKSGSFHCYWKDVYEWHEEYGYHGYTIWVCEEQQLLPDDGAGGTSGCYYEPGGCEEEPDPTDPPLPPGGGGPGNTDDDDDNNSCPTGQVEDVDGNCITGEVPCEGNPVKNPRIAAQTNSGVDGGRFTVGDDAVRKDKYGNFKDHKGLDIKTIQGQAIFSMYDGVVKAAIENNKDFGNYVIVSYTIDGIDYWVLYAHLDTINIDYGAISKGTPIGTAGISGNLEGAILDGYTSQHVHIEVRIGGWKDKTPKNPEDILSTEFTENGNLVAETDC